MKHHTLYRVPKLALPSKTKGYLPVTTRCKNLTHYLDVPGTETQKYQIRRQGCFMTPVPLHTQKKYQLLRSYNIDLLWYLGGGKLKHAIPRGTSNKLPEQKQCCLCPALACYLALPTVNQISTEKPSLGHDFVCSRPLELPVY